MFIAIIIDLKKLAKYNNILPPNIQISSRLYTNTYWMQNEKRWGLFSGGNKKESYNNYNNQFLKEELRILFCFR